MKFRVVVLPRAQQDIADTRHFIANVHGQPLVAERRVDGIEAAIQSLTERPLRGKAAPERAFWAGDAELRHLLFHHHRILYAVSGDTVCVVHVRRGCRRGLEPGDV